MSGKIDSGENPPEVPVSPRLAEAFQAIDYLMRKFWLERFGYFACALTSVGLLGWTIITQVNAGEFGREDWGVLFGSSGVFGLTSLGVLFVFRQAYKIIDKALRGDDE